MSSVKQSDLINQGPSLAEGCQEISSVKLSDLKPNSAESKLFLVQTVLSQGQRKPWDHVSEESAQRIRLG